MNQRFRIIMYHYVRELPNTRYPEIKGLLTSQFRAQVKFLRDSGCHFLSVPEVMEAAQSGKSLPENSVMLTFDDGYIDHFTNVFPVLDEFGIPGFFSMPGKIIREKKLLDVNRIHFILASTPIEKIKSRLFRELDYYRGHEFDIPSNDELYQKLAVASRFDTADTIFVKRVLQVELPVMLRDIITMHLFELCVGIPEYRFADELYLSLDQVRTMQRHGMTWGIHGYDHSWMNRMSEEDLRKDLTDALDVFDGIVDRDSWICCYPYGSVSDDVVRCASSLGAVGGLSTEVRVADLSKDSIFSLPRLDTNDFPPKSSNYLIIE